jgi:hypothetical protein
MTTIFKTVTTAVGLAVFAATLTPNVFAGCGEIPGKRAASISSLPQSHLAQSVDPPARLIRAAGKDAGGAAIVGLWSVKLTSLGNPGIPDGELLDWGYQQWHSDGTESFNSGGHPPALQNFWLGVWAKTGASTFTLYKEATLPYDEDSGEFLGTSEVCFQVTVDKDGGHFTGTFATDVFAPYGSHFAHMAGRITGERLVADQKPH